MNVNLNQECTVVLFQRGVEAIEKHYSDLDIKIPKEYAIGDEFTAPLWGIMNIFGSYTFMGPMPPFETTIKLEAL